MEESATMPQVKHTIPLRGSSPVRSASFVTKLVPLVMIIAVIAVGIFSGLILSSRQKNQNQAVSLAEEENLDPKVKESFTQTFKDQAEGTIEKNADMDKYAQGTHKLIRSGGESQTAFLTSSVLDLDEFVGKRVKVYGETFGSKQVGWLMDVGKVEEIQ